MVSSHRRRFPKEKECCHVGKGAMSLLVRLRTHPLYWFFRRKMKVGLLALAVYAALS